MFFKSEKKQTVQEKRAANSLYPVAHVAGSLKEYQKQLVRKEVESLRELSMIGSSFSGVMREADHFQEELHTLEYIMRQAVLQTSGRKFRRL